MVILVVWLRWFCCGFFGFEVVSVVVLWCGCGGVVLVVLLWW